MQCNQQMVLPTNQTLRSTRTHDVPHERGYTRHSTAELQDIVHWRLHSSCDLAVEVRQEDIFVIVPDNLVCRMLRRQGIKFGNHPLQGKVTELQGVIGL